MSRKLIYALVAGLALSVSGLATNPAHALLFNWSFTSSTGSTVPGGTISGTIDGLVEGNNSGAGLTIVVLNTPTGDLELLTNWNFFLATVPGNAFTVTGGQVSFASAQYGITGIADLFFGTDPQGATNPPQLSALPVPIPLWVNNDVGNVFTPVIVQVPPTDVPEPATLALFGAGLVGLGYIRRRRVS